MPARKVVYAGKLEQRLSNSNPIQSNPIYFKPDLSYYPKKPNHRSLCDISLMMLALKPSPFMIPLSLPAASHLAFFLPSLFHVTSLPVLLSLSCNPNASLF